jgi:hypothetical protein
MVAKLKCIEETDEIGRDDIYLVLLIGRRSSPKKEAEVRVVGPGGVWSNLETGDPPRNTDVPLDSNYQPNDFYMVAMVEQDAGSDVSASKLDMQFEPLWKAFGVNVTNATDETIATNLTHFLNHFIGGAGDDELVGSVRLLKKPKPGKPSSMRFQGDGGDYKVWFKLK